MDEPISKKVKRELCKKLLTNGKRCSFPHQLNSEYCKRHTQALTCSIETNTESMLMTDSCINTENILMNDSCTNTEGTMLDITTANETILCMLEELTKKDEYIDELQYKFNKLKEKVIESFIEKS